MRIYLAGAFGEGKTLLKNVIADRYKLTTIPEQVRVITAEQEIESLAKLRSNTDAVVKFQTEALSRQYKSELALGDNFVSCRCIDIVTFLAFFGGRDSLYLIRNSKVYDDYINWLFYEDVHIFYILPQKSLIKSDGFRDTDWELALQISGAVRFLLDFEGIKYMPIHPLTQSDREKIIFNHLDTII